MTGTATQLDVYVGYYGAGTTLWHVAPPLEDAAHILICDRTALIRVTAVEGEPHWAAGVVTKVPTPVEVFPADESGTVTGDHMETVAEPISLLRIQDGIDIDQILFALGYEHTPDPATEEPTP